MHSENNGFDNGRDEKGKFLPGNPGKPKGSSKNKLRDEIKSFLNDNWESFPSWFTALKPKEKIEVYLALLPYGVSRLQSVTIADDEGNPIERGIDFSIWSSDDLRLLISLQKKYAIINNQE